MNFAVPADHKMKLKECEKRNNDPDLARELKNLWNIEVTIILLIIGALGTVLLQELKDLEITGRVETIQTPASARILRRVLET